MEGDGTHAVRPASGARVDPGRPVPFAIGVPAGKLLGMRPEPWPSPHGDGSPEPSRAPLGTALSQELSRRLFGSLIQAATEVSAELSRQTARLVGGDGLGPPAALESIEAQHRLTQRRFREAGAWLAVVSAGMGAEIGNRRLVPDLLGSLEALLLRALDGPTYEHDPAFSWPALARGAGQSFEAPLVLLMTLLVADIAQGRATKKRRLGLRCDPQGCRFEAWLERLPDATGKAWIERWRAQLPLVIPGADLELLEVPPDESGPGARPACLRLELPAGWLDPENGVPGS